MDLYTYQNTLKVIIASANDSREEAREAGDFRGVEYCDARIDAFEDALHLALRVTP